MEKRSLIRTFALLLIVLAGVMRAAPAFAAPRMQDDDAITGTWQSEVYKGNQGSFSLTAVFFDDGSLEVASFYEGDDAPYVELGDWESDGDGNVTVYVTGTPDGDYDQETVLDFVLDDDTMLAEDFTSFSDDGLLLTKESDDTVSFLADDSAASDDSAVSEDVAASEEITTSEDITASEDNAVSDDSAATDDSALSEDAAADSGIEEIDESVLDLPGLYTTGELDAEGSIGGSLVMLKDDGTAQTAALRFDGGESAPSSHLGEWAENEDGSITVTMTQQIKIDGDEVQDILDLDESTPLTFTVVNGILVSDLFNLYPIDELEYFWAPDSATSDAGADEALTEDVQAADDASTVAPADGTEDNAADAAADASDDSAASTAAASTADDATATASSSDTVSSSDAASSSDDATSADDSAANVRQYSTSTADLKSGRAIVLALADDGTATLLAMLPSSPTVTETGVWEEDDDDVLTVTLTSDLDGEKLDNEDVLVFEHDGDGLVATDFDADRYGDAIELELVTD